MLKLSQTDLKRFVQPWPIFQWVEKTTGVPAEAVAAVWYRESFSMAPPATPGGSFQFDPPPSTDRICALFRQFTNLPPDAAKALASKGVSEFHCGALLAACWLRNKVGPVITPSVSDEVIKDAFWGYNGRAFGSADHSPYVMNGSDSSHDDMHMTGTIPDGKGGRKKIDIIDKRPGAFVVYRQLKEEIPAVLNPPKAAPKPVQKPSAKPKKGGK